MPQYKSSIVFNTTPIKSITVNQCDWGANPSNNAPLEVTYDSYTCSLNINYHQALQDCVTNQHATNNIVFHEFNRVQMQQQNLILEMEDMRKFVSEWKDLAKAYYENEAVRKTIDQAKLVAGIIKAEE